MPLIMAKCHLSCRSTFQEPFNTKNNNNNSIYENTRLATSKHAEENEHYFLCSICCSAIGQLGFQMSRVTPGVKFSNALSRFRKRKTNSSSK